MKLIIVICITLYDVTNVDIYHPLKINSKFNIVL